MSPFDVHFIGITKTEEYQNKAEEIYQRLKEASLDVVYDDRKVSPGYKFKDADLLGVPLQIILRREIIKRLKN